MYKHSPEAKMKRFISALTAIAYSVLCLLPVSAEGLSSYDPRGTDMVSSASSQGKSGACWAFAAVACIEQELITKGEENASVDLSEAALIAASGGEEPFSQAGSAAQAELTLAAGKGLCFEQFEPFIGSKPEAAVVSDEKAEVMEYSLSRAYEIDKADIKLAVKKHGAVYLSQYYNKKYISEDGESYYCPTAFSVNHAAAIVGWDDSYPKESFPTAPENDGAWLIKGSWGASVSSDGYYYISYEDKSISGFTVFETDEAHSKTYALADRLPAVNISAGSKVSAASVFTSENDEMLSSVGFMSMSSEPAQYTLSVYTDLENGTPEGRLMASASGKISAKGFYSAELDKAVRLTKGERFSVVLTLSGSKPSIAAMRGRQTASGIAFAKAANGWEDLSESTLGAYAPYIFAYTDEDVTALKEELRAEINRLFDSSSCQREIVYALQKFGRKSSAAELKNALLLLRSAEREQDEALIIGSTAEWESFCERVAEGEDFSGQIVTLSADLDFGGETISPVGDDGNGFAGVFDGNGHIIKNAVIDSGDSEYSGLFSILTEGACVTGVTLKDCKVFGMSSGGICGRSVRCEIKRCAVFAEVSGADYEDALAGQAKGAMLSDCIADIGGRLSKSSITERILPTSDKKAALSTGIFESREDTLTEKRKVTEHAYGVEYVGSQQFGELIFREIHCGIMEIITPQMINAVLDGLNI